MPGCLSAVLRRILPMADSVNRSALSPIIPGYDSGCSYLPGRVSRMEYRLAESLLAEDYEQLLARGWRRFGRTLFRPACPRCRECRSLRIILPRFESSKSQRRCLRRNSDIRLVVQPPTVTDDHIRLYNDYHRDMAQRRGWPFQQTNRETYHDSFADGDFEFAREFLYWRNNELIGLGIVDVTDRVQSSVYFVHAPSWRPAGPGTYAVLREIEFAQAAGRERLYMGYYIRDCGSMNYKNRFEPHEFLRDYVGDDDMPEWNEPDV